MQRVLQRLLIEGARVLEILLYVTQDTAVRLAVAFYALPAFAMACLLGMVDGLVKRDLRKWAGGRESSFVYHHSKHYTAWFLTAGFALYLSWPVGGFNPAWCARSASVARSALTTRCALVVACWTIAAGVAGESPWATSSWQSSARFWNPM